MVVGRMGVLPNAYNRELSIIVWMLHQILEDSGMLGGGSGAAVKPVTAGRNACIVNAAK